MLEITSYRRRMTLDGKVEQSSLAEMKFSVSNRGAFKNVLLFDEGNDRNHRD